MAEEKKSTAGRRGAEPISKKYTGLPAGEHQGFDGAHGIIKIPESGNYETSDPVEQGYIESVLGGTAKE